MSLAGVWAIVVLLGFGFAGGWYGRGYLDRLLVREMIRRKLVGEQTVRVNWNPTVSLQRAPTDSPSTNPETEP